jgi:hypothetical protein
MMMNKKKKFLLAILALLAASSSAQVGIGTRNPDEASMLDIVSTDKGVLIPRVSLQSVKQILNINRTSQPSGLLVYNETGSLPEGFYFWNGTEWKHLESRHVDVPSIASLRCEHAVLEPALFKASQTYSGLLKIPYTGGNGGKYSIGAWIPSTGNTGLRIRIKAGRLEYGSGELVYDVEGVPAYDSPSGATFPIDFSGESCSVTVGEEQSVSLTSIATVGPLSATSDNNRAGYHRYLTSPDGRFSVRVFVPNDGTILANADLQIRCELQSETILWNGRVSWNGGYKGTGSSLNLPLANVWYGNNGDNGNIADAGLAAAWGDADVYYVAPEQRRYTWTTTNPNDRTVYVLTFMLGAPTPSAAANDQTVAATKAFLRIEQLRPN